MDCTSILVASLHGVSLFPQLLCMWALPMPLPISAKTPGTDTLAAPSSTSPGPLYSPYSCQSSVPLVSSMFPMTGHFASESFFPSISIHSSATTSQGALTVLSTLAPPAPVHMSPIPHAEAQEPFHKQELDKYLKGSSE